MPNRIGSSFIVWAIAVLVAVGLPDTPLTRAQSTAASKPRFEVASIRRSIDCDPSASIYGAPLSPAPGRLTLSCATVSGLILGAYGRYANGRTSLALPPSLVGGPSWIHSEHYTVSAKAGSDENRAMMNGPMLQTLLEDRFQLKIHHETRQVPVFVLSVGKTQTRLKPFEEGTCVPVDYAQGPPRAPGQLPFCQNRIRSKSANLRTVDVLAATLPAFSDLLGVVLGRPVIDRTGIPGRFDFHLEFAIDQSTPGFVPEAAPANPADAVSIFTAVQEQLGLKLESAKGPGEFLVIDQVQRPSEN